MREKQVAELVSTGLTNREVATELWIGAGTVKFHLNWLLLKLSLQNRVQLAVWWREQNT